MKSMLILFTSLFVIRSYAFEPQPVFAQMNCDIYHTRMENKMIKESKLLVSNKGNRFEIGMAQWLKTELPAPFQTVTVSFNHFSSYYHETGPSTSTPYIQAYFEKNKEAFDMTRVNFDIKNSEEGSKVLLRGTYRFSSESLLVYDCYFTFVK